MLRCGLLGEKLGHSHSPAIHKMLGDYEYKLYEKSESEAADFIKNGEWDGLNVTIPYKKLAASLCDELSDIAKELGSVNTLVRCDGKIIGHNTDYFGFKSMTLRLCGDIRGKKAIVLGSGGTGVTVCKVLRDLGAYPITISRSCANNYQNIEIHSDAEIVVNATPVGMYPNNMRSPLDLTRIKGCKYLLDVIFNPCRTALVMQAESLGIKAASGLHMLIVQAKHSSEMFQNSEIPDETVASIEKLLTNQLENVILIGMPGSGKSALTRAIGKKLGKEVVETDSEIVNTAGKSIPEIFEQSGEEGFRAIETEILKKTGRLQGKIISTGGGVVTRPENYLLLHQNGVIVFITRDIHKLPTNGRPISQKSNLYDLYRKRKPLYESFCDISVDNNSGTISEVADNIISEVKRYMECRCECR